MVTILLTILKETLFALVGKIAFKAIAERLITRLVFKGLDWLKAWSTNDVADETIEDIKNSLKGKKLYVADNE